MNSILPLKSDSINLLITLLGAAVVLEGVWIFVLHRALAGFRGRLKDLFAGETGTSIERLLMDHLQDRMTLHELVESVDKRVGNLEGKMLKAKRHVGLVRYDAFDDVAGEQSFALAIYDDRGDGAVITSLVGRKDCRVYCKPLKEGRSEARLAKEEDQAIAKAAGSAAG